MRTVEKIVKVNAPIDVVYATWENLTVFPAITNHVIMAERVTYKHSHWVVEILGYRIQFEAEIDQMKPNEFISWHAVTQVHHSGSVHFSKSNEGTQVALRLMFKLDNLAGDVLDDLNIAWDEFEDIFKEVLSSFKGYVEQMWRQVPAAI